MTKGHVSRKMGRYSDISLILFNLSLESFKLGLSRVSSSTSLYQSLKFLFRMVDMAQEWGERCNEGKSSWGSRVLVKGTYWRHSR